MATQPLVFAPDFLAGRYVIQREIGRGGMATVYLAEEVKHGRPVAIKVLHPEPGSAMGGQRFLREIRIAARLSHPHLVPLLDSGESHGHLYYVSAYVPGGSLRDRLRADGRLAPDDAVRITCEIGAALDFVHRAGFVHRDVKPENILFADGHALLSDFGIARACSVERSEPITTSGLVFGTPEYMSPEQASGDQDLGVRSDVYSLACVLFEMIGGRPPFSGGPARAIMARQVTEAPARLRVIAPDAPAGIDSAVARALSKDPERRHPSVTAFTTSLAAAPPPPARTRAVTHSVAVLPFVNTSSDPENEYLSDGITDELIDALAKVSGLRVAARTSVFALKGKPQDVRAIGALLDCTHVLEGTVRRSGQQLRVTAQLSSTEDGGLIWSQRFDRRIDDVFAIQDELAQTIVGTLRSTSFGAPAPPAQKRHTQNVQAYRLYLRGRYEWNRRTQEGVAAGIHYFEQAIAEDPGYALAYTGLADCHALGVDYRSVPVSEGFEAAKAYARKAIALDDTLAEAHASLAWSLFVYDWEWAAAEAEFKRAVALDPHYAIAHQWYAFLLASRAMLNEALVESHTAVELDQGSVSARRSLGWAYYYARRYDQARYHLERAIAMNPMAEETFRTLGLVLAVSGAPDEAVRVLSEAVVLPDTGTYTQATLGYAHARAGRPDVAAAILTRLEALAEREYVSPVAFATIHLGLGDVERALDWAHRARSERRGWLAYLRVNPILDPLRGHPRFDALIGAMRLTDDPTSAETLPVRTG